MEKKDRYKMIIECLKILDEEVRKDVINEYYITNDDLVVFNYNLKKVDIYEDEYVEKFDETIKLEDYRKIPDLLIDYQNEFNEEPQIIEDRREYFINCCSH